MLDVSIYEQSNVALLLLVPQINANVRQGYLDDYDLPLDEVGVAKLHIEPKQKVAAVKDFTASEIIPTIQAYGTKYVLCSHAEYFRAITGKKVNVKEAVGYVFPIPETDAHAVYIPDIKSRFYNPTQFKASMDLAIKGLLSHASGDTWAPGMDIIKDARYLTTDEEIEAALEDLLKMDVPLTADIEAFHLRHVYAGLGTITFCWDQHSGIAFNIDYLLTGQRDFSSYRRKLVKRFFQRFKNKMIYHNASFDVSVLIYQLFMKDITDTEGLLEGLEVMMSNYEDTKLIAYLATNSCAESPLGLKYLAHEFAGKYSLEEIEDITKVEVAKLLEYNLVDGLATWYVYNKYYPIMVKDQQLELYTELFKPVLIDIVQMQLTGLPINMATTRKVAAEMQKTEDDLLESIAQHPAVQSFNEILKREFMEKKNASYKKKVLQFHDPVVQKQKFLPSSDTQKRKLVFDFLGLPVLDTTDTGMPSTKKDIIKNLVNHTDIPDVKELLTMLVELADVSIILSTFIPAFLSAPQGPDGWHYVFGFYNLGGTVSGRLSSNQINISPLQ